jgi:hypothetical protein
MNPYAKNSYSYSPSSWLANGERVDDDEYDHLDDNDDEQERPIPLSMNSAGARRSKRMRGRGHTAGSIQGSPGDDGATDDFERENSIGRRRQRVSISWLWVQLFKMN